MQRGVMVWCVLAGLVCVACDDDEAARAEQQTAAAREGWDESPAAVPADQPGVEDTHRPHLNLQNLAHLADVQQGGLFMDFGTPARMKYTIGHWKTGWGSDGEDKAPFTRVGSKTARVYFPIDEPEPYVLRFRMKPVGSEHMMVFLNNEQLPSVRLTKGPGFAEYDLQVPEDVVQQGENYLLLRFGGTKKVGDEEVSVAVDYIWAMPAEQSKGRSKPPRYADVVQDVTLDAKKHRALVSAGPGRFSWYLEVPDDSKLSLRVGNPQGAKGPSEAIVRLTPAGGGSPKELMRDKVESRWQDKVLSLDDFAGRVVRLDLEARGGPAAWSSPAILVPGPEPVALEGKPKNVIVLLIDTLRADKLRSYDPDSRVQTPVLDQLAQEGTVFERAQAPENWTKPSVASVLTGLYPMTHRTKKSESRLSDDALMVSEVFKKEGFATGTFLANGYVSDKFGFKQGWDHYTNYIRESKSTEAENVFGEAGDWIEAHKDQRFFAYIQTIDPHVPYDPPDAFLERYDAGEYDGQVRPRRTPDLLEKAKRNPPKVVFDDRDRARLEALHDGEISYHDKYLGKFIARLKKLGVYDETLFVVTSDHGEEFYEHGSYGHGHSVYQEMIHVPLIYRFPAGIPAGRRISDTVSTVDISPTILSATDIGIPEVMEGMDRMSHLRGLTPEGPKVAFSDFLDDRRVIRGNRWKLVLRGLNETLFDLKSDPGEQRELDLDEHPIAMRHCRVLLGQFLGASDLKNWLSAEQADKARLRDQETDIDPTTREQLRGLGYAN